MIAVLFEGKKSEANLAVKFQDPGETDCSLTERSVFL